MIATRMIRVNKPVEPQFKPSVADVCFGFIVPFILGMLVGSALLLILLAK
jgi:hypothetical protein